MNEIQRLLRAANERLKLGKIGVSLVVQGKGDWLYVRGTFPPRPGSNKDVPYQTRIALGIQALDHRAIKRAELTAKQIGLDLNIGAFDWRKFSDFAEPQTKTAADWIKEYEEKWWRTRDRSNPSHQNTWKRGYRSCLSQLPDKPLTEDLLIDWIVGNSRVDTRRRGHYITCAAGLAEMAGIPTAEIRRLGGSYGIKPINPRKLPNDAAIATIRKSIADPGWRHVYGLMATYGLRNHEVWRLDFRDFPIARVDHNTKTGARPIKPLYPEWAKEWELDKGTLPDHNQDGSLEYLGALVTRWFQHNLGSSPYDLRHSYARRCAEFGLPSNIAAKLMGHSTRMHEIVYQCWIGEQAILGNVDKAIARADRPMPPSQ